WVMSMRLMSVIGGRSSLLLQVAVPQVEQAVPGLLGGDRMVDRALAEREPVVGALEDLDRRLDAGLLDRRLEVRDHVVRHRVVGLGEAEIELALDAVEQ